MIRRCSRLGPRSYHGPNEKFYCVECEENRPNGYVIDSVPATAGTDGMFICDDCLAKAKRYGVYRAGIPGRRDEQKGPMKGGK